VQFSAEADLNTAISICREEIELIDAAISSGGVPAPSNIPEHPSTSDFEFQSLGHASKDDAAPMAIESGEQGEVRRLAALSLWDRFADFPPRDDILRLAAKIRETAKQGKIVLVGKYARLLALNLLWHGRRPIALSAFDQGRDGARDILRRPPRGSFLSWLCANAESVGDLGAIVFVGEHDFKDERASLADLGSSPPVIRVKVGPRGAIAEMDTEFARHSDAGGISWPKISVITVSFNQARFLEASMRSVLDQNYPNLEYIVIDGGSTDGSVDIINRYRDRCAAVVIEPDRGQSDALNKGFALATGEVMTWLCSDDLLEPGALAQVARTYRRHGTDLIVGGCVRIGETRDDVLFLHHSALPLGRTVRLSALDILRFMRSWEAGNYFFQPEVFFSRRVWLDSGAYIKEHLFYAMDYDLWLRMALAGATVRHVPATIGCSRVHAQQKTQSDRKYLHQMRRLMQEYEELFLGLQAADAMAKSSACCAPGQ